MFKSIGPAVRENWRWVLGVAFSAAVTFFSFPPHQFGILMLVGLVPLFVALENAKTWKQALFRGWLYGFLCNVFVCFWVTRAIYDFARLPWLLSYSSIFVISIWEQSSWALFALLRFVLHRRIGVRPLLWSPVAIYAIEAVWPKIFPNTMGNAFFSVPVLAQAADVAGVWGLTALIVATNEAIAWGYVVVCKRAQGPETINRHVLIRHAFVGVSFLTLASLYGSLRLQQVRANMAKPIGSLRIAMIQPNLNFTAAFREAKNSSDALERMLHNLMALTDKALTRNPDLVFWPEGAYPSPYRSDSMEEHFALTSELDKYVKSRRISLLFGTVIYEVPRRYNALVLTNTQFGNVDTEVLRMQDYKKNLLLELGEFIPFSKLVPRMNQILHHSGGLAVERGTQNELFQGITAALVDGSKKALLLGPSICIEGLYPRYIRDQVIRGANVLVNGASDAWFGKTMEPDLHLQLTAFRAIETRRPIARATTTGYTATIDIDGSLRQSTKLFEVSTIVDDVPIYDSETTIFVGLGNTFLGIAIAFSLLAFIAPLGARRFKAIRRR